MKTISGGASVMAALMLLLLLVPTTEAAITCSDVVNDLTPCLSYLQSGKGTPSASCCSGASKLLGSATNTADTKTACNCMKSTIKQLNLNGAASQSLAGKCGIKLSFTVSANTDCSKIG
ncbi:non-specific lipid-transfer protein AP10-like [Telopea speciosissima]|uniref:non-specific lipid-transfer protein AP10-like n=1 Tax=Telopea speciosissima TaxID=54955 RepID=UPI001CC6C23C|nr:non-specific lipid-transfer protein AP10-like [Telopea speciosissima]